MWFREDTTYRIRLCNKPPARLSPSCTRSDTSSHQGLEQAHRLRGSDGPLGDISSKLHRPPFGELMLPLPRAPRPLTLLEHAEVVGRAGRLAVGGPGGFDDLFQGIGGFVEDDLAWSVEVIQRVGII